MADPVLAKRRLVAQGLITRPFATPTKVAAAFGAMQGQDLPGVLASAALRTRDGGLDAVFSALADGSLVRAYPMRGTVFLMAGADAVWVTQLCAAGSIRASMSRNSRLGLTDADVARSVELAEEALAEGPLSRADLFARWELGGLATGGGRGYHLLFLLIANTRAVYGPWNGSDQGVAAVDQWLPDAKGLAELFDGDTVAATAELARRYFSSHGPATVRDFAWWSKRPLTESRRALELLRDDLETDGAPEPSFWRPGLADEVAEVGRDAARPLLLPGFDEFILGYQDRTYAMSNDEHQRIVPGNNGMFRKTVVAGGKVLGTWARTSGKERRLVVEEFSAISATRRRQLEACFAAYPWTAA